MDGTWISIDQAIVFTFSILTHSAKAPFPLGNATPMGAQFALYIPTFEGSEIRRKLCLNKTLLGHLSRRAFRETEEVCQREHAKACPTKLQKLSFCQLRTQWDFIHYQTFHVINFK